MVIGFYRVMYTFCVSTRGISCITHNRQQCNFQDIFWLVKKLWHIWSSFCVWYSWPLTKILEFLESKKMLHFVNRNDQMSSCTFLKKLLMQWLWDGCCIKIYAYTRLQPIFFPKVEPRDHRHKLENSMSSRKWNSSCDSNHQSKANLTTQRQGIMKACKYRHFLWL